MSINTTLNSTVIFTCVAKADELIFLVNNISANNVEVKSKGFTVKASGTGTIKGELQAIAYDFNNNTKIRCSAITDHPQAKVFSNTSLLLIQGFDNFFFDQLVYFISLLLK